jgi:predicted dehydrogenase
MTLKLAFIGAGFMAREHIKAFESLENVDIVGIHSRTSSKAEALAADYNIPLVATSISELYQEGMPDLVVVSVSIVPARDILLECIEHGIALLTEKPVALDYEQSMEVRDAAKAAGVPIWVGLNRRCYSATLNALSDLEVNSGPRIIQVFDQQDREFAVNAGHPQAVVDNWMYAGSIHLVDYLLTFGRDAVSGVDIHHSYDPKAPKLVNATVRFDSGDIGIYMAVWDAPGPWACHVTTPEVRWEMQPLEDARCCKRGSRQWDSISRSDADNDFKAGVLVQAEAVIAAIRNGDSSLVVDIDEAMRTTKLIADIYGLSY